MLRFEGIDDLLIDSMQRATSENPSRFVVSGLGPNSLLRQLVAIMGRSENSQNRIYEVDYLGNAKNPDEIRVRTAPHDASKVKDPSLIIYDTMVSVGNIHIIGNGDQVNTVEQRIGKQSAAFLPRAVFAEALDTRFCEPDIYPDTNLTPRITSYVMGGDINAYFSILIADPIAKSAWQQAVKEASEHGISPDFFKQGTKRTDSEAKAEYLAEISRMTGYKPGSFPTARSTFALPLHNGVGYGISTYEPDDPKALISFAGPPFKVPMDGSLEDTMKTFWVSLDKNYRVAVIGKEINPDSSYRVAKPLSRFDEVVKEAKKPKKPYHRK